MGIKIKKIEKASGRRNLFRVIFDNGEEFDTDPLLVSKYDYFEDKEVSPDDFVKFKDETMIFLAKQKCLTLLEKKMYTSYELEKKLWEKKIARKYIDSVLSSLTDSGLIDDKKYAEIYVASQMRRNKYSLRQIREKLKMKGVAPEYIESALEKKSRAEKGYEKAVIRDLAEKKWRTYEKRGLEARKIKEKVYAYLSAKGFSYEKITEILRELYEK